MYSDQENKKAKIGKVNLDFHLDKYRVRWTYPKGNRNQIRLDCDWHEAIKTAKMIDRDIELNDVDLTYARYSSKQAQTIHIVNKQPNLLDLWITYKRLSRAY